MTVAEVVGGPMSAQTVQTGITIPLFFQPRPRAQVRISWLAN